MTARSVSQTIGHRFAAAAESYDQQAAPQRAIAAQLAATVRQHWGDAPPPRRCLDIGCGTGFLGDSLRDWSNRNDRSRATEQNSLWLASDLALPMVQACRRRLPFAQGLVMNGEAPAVRGGWNLIVSSLAVQWFQDLVPSLHRLHGLLAAGGLLALTTLGDQTFARWRRACADAKGSEGTPSYPTLAALRTALPDADINESFQPVPVTTARDFLQHLRGIGASTPTEGHHPLSPAQLRHACRHLDAALERGETVDYHVLTVVWRSF